MPRRLTAAPAASSKPPAAVISLQHALALVIDRWRHEGAHSEQTLTRMGETITRFTHRLTAQHVPSFAAVTAGHAAGFVAAPTAGGGVPELATQHARRTPVRTLYRTLRQLDLATGVPTLDLHLPPRGVLAARPLTEDEITLARASAPMGTRRLAPLRTTAWALAEATAVSSEITTVRIVDLDSAARPETVRLPGTRRHRPRTAPLTPWGRRVLAARVDELASRGATEQTLLAYGGHAPPGGPKAQAAVCNAITTVLTQAGLAGESDVRPSSVRHWAGRAAYGAGATLPQVALMLGHRSLDATCEDIALDWQATTSAFEQEA